MTFLRTIAKAQGFGCQREEYFHWERSEDPHRNIDQYLDDFGGTRVELDDRVDDRPLRAGGGYLPHLPRAYYARTRTGLAFVVIADVTSDPESQGKTLLSICEIVDFSKTRLNAMDNQLNNQLKGMFMGATHDNIERLNKKLTARAAAWRDAAEVDRELKDLANRYARVIANTTGGQGAASIERLQEYTALRKLILPAVTQALAKGADSYNPLFTISPEYRRAGYDFLIYADLMQSRGLGDDAIKYTGWAFDRFAFYLRTGTETPSDREYLQGHVLNLCNTISEEALGILQGRISSIAPYYLRNAYWIARMLNVNPACRGLLAQGIVGFSSLDRETDMLHRLGLPRSRQVVTASTPYESHDLLLHEYSDLGFTVVTNSRPSVSNNAAIVATYLDGTLLEYFWGRSNFRSGGAPKALTELRKGRWP